MTLEEAVKALGETEESISEKLRSMGIRGVLRSASFCPLAKYFNKCGFEDVTVSATVTAYYSKHADEPVVCMWLPTHISQWEQHFDAGHYPEFEV